MIELLSTETKPVYIGYNKLAAYWVYFGDSVRIFTTA